ncbi:MAG: hypothetical protein A2017_10930 [Lentisphaerae bacterium GWF2_44_16]|nr:MAG: hypothetical protein A2017_10930 [Lentisphaerae bacterium GWF2_44_16]
MDFIWDTDTMIDEPVLFKRDNSDKLTGRLLFPPLKIDSVRNDIRSTVYQERRDFTANTENGVITLTDNSRIPFLSDEELYPHKDTPNAYPEKKNSDRYMLHSEKELFPSYQICFSYRHRKENFMTDGECPHFELPVLMENLISGKSFSMTVFGDSISTGLNATKLAGLAPFNPPYFEIVAAEIKKIFSCDVMLKNESVAGKTSEWGLANIENAARHKSELVILAWGMNDASGKRSQKEFKKNISNQMKQVRSVKPEAEFLLISGMTANPEWSRFSPGYHIEYLKALCELAREEKGTAVVNITDIWFYMTEKKSYLDLSGNGLNHPNDFGHKIYAQLILKTILDISEKKYLSRRSFIFTSL